MFVHGHQAAIVLKATIISIPKDYSKSLCNDSNYRGIALCSSIAKLLDIIVMTRNENALALSDMQCAFKAKHSTATCTYVVKEVAQYYINGGSDVYACFLDATKAFDRVQFSRLFEVLIDRRVHPIDLRLLLDLYKRQSCRTRWKGGTSPYFSVGNGIRQGSVISPVLFCAYLDILLLSLEEQKIGCHVGNKFYGCTAYADDIVLMSPTLSGLSSMLKQCDEYSQKYHLKFNASKSMCMRFGRLLPTDLPEINFSGAPITWVNQAKHLGNVLTYNLSEQSEINYKRGDLAGRVNSLKAKLPLTDDSISIKLFTSQCCHLYGCEIWNVCDQAIKLFVTMHNRSVRRILNLPYTTHTAYLPCISGGRPITEQIHNRISKFSEKLLKKNWPIGKTIF